MTSSFVEYIKTNKEKKENFKLVYPSRYKLANQNWFYLY